MSAPPAPTVPDAAGAIAFALARLRDELPPTLHYHSLWHTTGEVMPAAAWLAAACDLPHHERLLVQVAAAFHDVGYIDAAEGHEERAAQLVAEILPTFGFDPGDIASIQGMIRATRVPQQATNLMEQILCDADLDGLGREDFFERSRALRAELAAAGHEVSDQEWNRGQRDFLREHHYFTPAAHDRRGPVKARNLARLESICRDHVDPA